MPAEPTDRPVVLPITAELDLHNFRPAEIPRLLDDHFAECLKRGLYRIRVVHGKGTGTLRGIVHARLRHSPLVASFATADERSGGWGATWVTLRTPSLLRGTAHQATEPPVTPLLKSTQCRSSFPRMSTTVLYALIMVIGQIFLTLIGFFLGYQTDKINQGTWFGFVPLIYAIVVYWLAIRAVREEDAGKYLTYGKGVSTGLMIAIYSGVIGSIYSYIHFTYINPNFTDYLIEASRVKWSMANMSDAQMEGAEKGMRMFTKPGIQSIFGFILTVVAGLVISLITAAFLKKNPPEEGQVSA